MTKEEIVPVSFLQECFEYHDDGVLTWKARPRTHFRTSNAHRLFLVRRNGKPLASLNEDGYLIVGVTYQGRNWSFVVSRIVWALHHGRWPDHEIDHINRVRTDNRIANLRDVPRMTNIMNSGARPNRLGVSGIHQKRSRFFASIFVDGKRISLGGYPTAEEANRAYQAASLRIRGYIPGVPVV